MKRPIGQLVIALAGGMFLLSRPMHTKLQAQEVPIAVSPTSADLQIWISELNDDRYERREAASRRLVAAGAKAAEALGAGILSENAETAWRSGSALESIAVSGEPADLQRVEQVLDRLSQSGKPGLNKLVAGIRVRQEKYRHERAVATVRGLGGRLIGGYGYDAGAIALADGPVFGGGAIVKAFAVEIAPAAPIPDAADLQVASKADEAAIPPAADALAPPPDSTLPDAPAVTAPAPAVDDAALAPPPLAADDALAPPPALADAPPLATVLIADSFIILDSSSDLLSGDHESEVSASLTLDSNWRGGDDGLHVLRELKEISTLTLEGAKLSDKALTHIAALPKLKSLHVRETPFTSAGLQQFRAKKPATTVFALGPAMLGINADVHGGPCVLSSVFYNSGAFLAGLQQGDKITKIDDSRIADFSDVTIAVYPHQPGDKLRIEYERAGLARHVEVLLKPRQAIEDGVRGTVPLGK